MSDKGSYGQFCPLSMASEIVCTRWTPLILREMVLGSRRFNDLRKGVPKMSPALLSKRLKELESAGVISIVAAPGGGSEYKLTPMGEDLKDVIVGLGAWGHRWVESRISLRNLDPSLLMWDMRRRLDPGPLPTRRCTIHFLYPELPQSGRNWWLVVEEGTVDLCYYDPGYEVDLQISGSLRAMTSVWMGISRMADEVAAGKLSIDGDRKIAKALDQWLGYSSFARTPRHVA